MKSDKPGSSRYQNSFHEIPKYLSNHMAACDKIVFEPARPRSNFSLSYQTPGTDGQVLSGRPGIVVANGSG